jgi:hypothetical protein
MSRRASLFLFQRNSYTPRPTWHLFFFFILFYLRDMLFVHQLGVRTPGAFDNIGPTSHAWSCQMHWVYTWCTPN